MVESWQWSQQIALTLAGYFVIRFGAAELQSKVSPCIAAFFGGLLKGYGLRAPGT